MKEIDFDPVNKIDLCGRVSSDPGERELPSGDVVLELRLVVPRSDRLGVDTLDLAFWKADLRRKARKLKIGDVIEVSGSLRRRFWQGKAGLSSRSQVEVSKVAKVN
ncbi:MAG TPA: single-stranded DNA-binding protein [Candidatus Nanopelagicaceae bacterium]|nr:single-stranded DNA-binding protein [Candidatus Nanopelagicaceae bacterium]